MSKQQRSIIYLGSDEEFLKELNSFSVILKDLKVRNETYQKGHLVSTSLSSPAHIIFVDFTEQDLKIKHLVNEVLLLKKTNAFKGCLFVGLFADDEHLTSFSYLFTSGFQLSFIKGCETEILFRDSFYISFGYNASLPTFARARNIQKEVEAGICSTVTYVSMEQLAVETDIEPIDGVLGVSMSFLPDLKKATFKIRGRHPCPILYPMTETCILEYPYPDPWGGDTENTIMRDTVETWISLNSEVMDLRNGFIKVICKNISLINELDDNGQSLPLFLDLAEKMSSDLLFDFQTKRPDLIFYEIDDEDAEGNSSDNLAQVVSTFKSLENYHPVLVISNSKSTGAAYQKIFQYQFITAMPNKLDKDVFNALTGSFISRKLSKSQIRDRFYFVPTDNRRSIDVLYNFMVTSLTEHEVTFLSDIELPMFTVLHFKLPLDFHVTVIPPQSRLEQKANRFHYMAIIHGMSEEKLKKLRHFVYQIIYKPLEDFSEATVTLIMDQMHLNKQQPNKDAPAGIEERKEPEPKAEPEVKASEIIGHFKIGGKSKL